MVDKTQLTIELLVLIIVLILARVLYLIHKITGGYSRVEPPRKPGTPCKTIICVGSGGHTTEILTLLQGFNFNKYSPRYYFLASNDKTSFKKILEFEGTRRFKIFEIPRSRIVNQSYVSSVFTTLYSIFYTIPLVLKVRPDLILCNGPGTCIPICLVGFLLKVAFIKQVRIVFVESYCRTSTLSLSGKILMYFADNFIVQWPSLKKILKRAEYIGQLM